jgi:hypothetical protein
MFTNVVGAFFIVALKCRLEKKYAQNEEHYGEFNKNNEPKCAPPSHIGKSVAIKLENSI